MFVLAACGREDDAAPTVAPTADGPAVADESVAAETAVPVETAAATATAVPPTATPRPAKSITVCLATEPENLYLYGDTSAAATDVRHGLYETMITQLGYDYQAQGVEKVPSLADGDAHIDTVTVQTGDQVVNASGDPVRLAPGVQIITADGEFLTYRGDESAAVQMQQMTVDFTLQPLVWSDGSLVTAVDSVFSFNVAAAPETAVDKAKVNRTASYEAVGELGLRWTGLPGFLDETYFLNVWTPLPSGQLGRFTAVDLLTAPEATQNPLSHGPYMVADWQPGNALTLTRNPHYYQAGLPHIGEVTFLFVEDGLAAVQNGRCHIATQETLTLDRIPEILEAAAADTMQAFFQNSLVFEHIDFGVDPVAAYAEERLDWFEDSRVREAMTLCTDRQRMIDDLLYGQGDILHAYVPDAHPLYPADAQTWAYDPAAGNALLDAAGFADQDGNGVRDGDVVEFEAVVATRPFSITLGTDAETPLRHGINQIFQENMRDCGIHVELYQIPALDWYADGPFSPLFGRRFDLGTFAWLTTVRPPCNLYLSRNITGPEEEGFGGWGNVNATGWRNEAYDAACEAALAALPGTPEYAANHQEAIRIFAQELPMIPLFSRVRVAIAAPQVSGLALDATQPSELWNMAQWDVPVDGE